MVGAIRANGGSAAPDSGGGSGGRIAISYDAMTLLDTNVLAMGGSAGSPSSDRPGAAGTVYLKNNAQAYGDLIIDNGGLWTTVATPAISPTLTLELNWTAALRNVR